MTKFGIFAVLVCLIILTGCSIRDCGSDYDCFKESLKMCQRTKVNFLEAQNNITGIIRGESAGRCKVSFRVLDLNDELKAKYPTEVSIAKGKTMNCLLEKNYEENSSYYDIRTINTEFERYCSGPLKDIIQGSSGYIQITSIVGPN